MNTIKAILVDDEEAARDVLENLLKRFCPNVELVDKCSNVIEAVESIKLNQPNVVFLDIEMPNYAGFEIVKFFETVNFDIVFVTAYDKYAIRAFEISAVDYLLKPIDIERLKESVAKVQNVVDFKTQTERLALLSNTLETKEIKNISITERGIQHIITIDSIIAIEAQESYCYIHTASKKYMVSKNLKSFETLFESLPHFVRVHKSWVINIHQMINYSKSELIINLTNGIVAKLSKYKKAEFEDLVI
jgi:two-component system, LytTR family, response regulator